MENLLFKIRKELKQNIDQKTLETAHRFFKEEIKIYGLKTAAVTKIAKKYLKLISSYEKSEIFSLCEELLKSHFMEEAFIAFNWSYSLRKSYEKKDFKIFEKWIKTYVSNWAECDTLCNHTVGSFLEKYPEFISRLYKWCESKNRWLRRAAAVSLVLPARNGMFLNEIFNIAQYLLTDKDDLVQKGYGWMLKEASNFHQKKVFSFVIKHKQQMPRTALRYGIEKMPKDMKIEAMKK